MHQSLRYEPSSSLSYVAFLHQFGAMLLFSLPWLSLFDLFVEGVLAQHRIVLL